MRRLNLIKARGQESQRIIAKKCGVSQKAYSHWECGRATPPIKKMIILEKILKRPKEELFDDVFNSGNELNTSVVEPTGTES
jgi:transcriptional regulator with XRE-family HTH domain